MVPSQLETHFMMVGRMYSLTTHGDLIFIYLIEFSVTSISNHHLNSSSRMSYLTFWPSTGENLLHISLVWAEINFLLKLSKRSEMFRLPTWIGMDRQLYVISLFSNCISMRPGYPIYIYIRLKLWRRQKGNMQSPHHHPSPSTRYRMM